MGAFLARALGGLLVAMLLAGCGEPGEPAPEGAGKVSSQGGPLPDVPVPWLNLTACEGLDFSFTWPDSMAPGRPPGNWSRAPGPGSDTIVFAYHCEQASTGPFVRPLDFVMEVHTDVVPPRECIGDDTDVVSVLASMWVEDREVADYLASAFSVPLVLGDIDVRVNRQAGTATASASWQNGTYPPSWVESTEASILPDGSRIVNQAYWHQDGAMRSLRLVQDPDYGLVPSMLVHGEMQPPMLSAALGTPVFAGKGKVVPQGTYAVEFITYGDGPCDG